MGNHDSYSDSLFIFDETNGELVPGNDGSNREHNQDTGLNRLFIQRAGLSQDQDVRRVAPGGKLRGASQRERRTPLPRTSPETL